MPKTKIYLTYQSNMLWWSTDKENWGITGKNSPLTTLGKNYELDWEAFDDSIDEIEIELENDEIFEPIRGNRKNKKGKVKSNAKNGAWTKYSIIVTPKNGKPITVDPDSKYCDPMPCVPNVQNHM